ncbi:MAG: S8 family peptidase [Wenzhouxiangellaceae bacterium]
MLSTIFTPITSKPFVTLAATALIWLANSSHAQIDENYSVIRGMKSAQRITNEYLVVLKQDIVSEAMSRGLAADSGAAVQYHAQELSSRYGGEIQHVYSHALTGFALKDIDKYLLEQLAEDPAVAYIQASQRFRAQVTQPTSLWGLDRIDQRNLPLSLAYTYEQDGTGVNAYVLDTGIRRSHSSFSGRVSAGFSAISDGRGSNDCAGHGTHVAATLGSNTYGVAKNVSLHPVRVLDCYGNGTTSTILAGIDWVAANHSKPAVANLSLGGPADSVIDQAITNLISMGVVVVVAAGNENQNACNVSPARASFVIAVGASTRSDRRAPYSNKGACIDVFAPGDGITSAWHTSNTASRSLDGTSMASPHVAGVAAMYLQNHPTASHYAVANAIRENVSTFVLSDVGHNTPNRLLNMTFLLSEMPPPPPLRAQVGCLYQGPGDIYLCHVSASQGQPPYQYQWYGALSSTSTSALYRSCPNGNHVQAVVTDAAGTQRLATRNISCTGGDDGGIFEGPR